MSLYVDSESVQHTEDTIFSQYAHKSVSVVPSPHGTTAKVEKIDYSFQTSKKIGKVGLLMVGLSGNNGTTIVGGIIANREKLTWNTKKGLQTANMLGSMTQCSTMKVADSEEGEIFMRLKEVIPMVNPEDLVLGGWDINSEDLASAMKRAQVFDYDLQLKLEPFMKSYKPMKSIYYPDFIASNQSDRADNLLPGNNKMEHLETIRSNIATFKKEHDIDTVIVLWTANTERFALQL